ncbi:hypothetical protein ACA910_007648 [Epithemia clementina (nom. ined.)]
MADLDETVNTVATALSDEEEEGTDDEEVELPVDFSSSSKSSRNNTKASAKGKKHVAAKLPSTAAMMFATTPRPQPKKQHVYGCTSPLFGTFANTTTPQAFVPASWFTQQDGTLSNPWIVQVDLLKPERNLAFDIQAVEGFDQDTFLSCNGFHIRKPVAAPDYDKWEAIILKNYEHQWHGQLVLIKGPAQDFWICKCHRYHGTGKIKCDATKKDHSATEIAIENSEDWFWSYYLLVFPP